MPNLRITLGPHSFMIEDQPSIEFTPGLLDALRLWLMTIDAPEAVTQNTINVLATRMQGQNYTLAAIVAAHPVPSTTQGDPHAA